MSKNSRTFRALMAGLFFAGLGILGTLTGESPPFVETGRGPATRGCISCTELKNLKIELLNHPGPESQRKRAKKAKIETIDQVILKKAAGVVVGVWKKGEASSEEIHAVTEFLVDSLERDGGGVVLNEISETFDESRTDQILKEIESEILILNQENVFTKTQAEAYRAIIAAFRAQGKD